MTSKTHLLTQLPRRTIKQELICSKASFVAVKLHLLTVYGHWSYFSIFRLFLGAIGESGMQGRVPGVHQETEEKQNYSLYYYRKKNVQFDTKIIEKGKEQLYVTFSCPSWQLLWKTGVCANFGTCIHLWAIFMTYEIICCTNYTDLTETMEFEHGFYCSGIYLHDITEETFTKAQMQRWSTSVGNTGSGF